jgi:hypothetical protein
MTKRRCTGLGGLLVTAATLLLLSACDDATEPEDRIIEGVDFSVLFAEPSQAEIDAVANEWAGPGRVGAEPSGGRIRQPEHQRN